MTARSLAPLLVLFVALAALPGCGSPASTEDPLAISAEAMNLTFPPSTRALGYYHVKDPANRRFEIIPGPDDAIWLKIEMDRKDVDSFLAVSPFAGEPLAETDRGTTGPSDQPWWDADRRGRFRSGQATRPQARYLNILIDMDGGERAVIYLEWYTT